MHSSYRFQLSSSTTKQNLDLIKAYLLQLGFDTLYLSPYLKSPSDRNNCYLITDPNHFQSSLNKDMESFLQELKESNIDHIFDLVSNHMAYHQENVYLHHQEYFDYYSYPNFYRRFFDINEMIGTKMENKQFFDLYHKKVIEMAHQGLISAIRVDHPDGLYSPAKYFKDLKAACPSTPLYAEKILCNGEKIPNNWPITGTVGYEYTNACNAIFVDETGYQSLKRSYDFHLKNPDVKTHLIEAKELILATSLQQELTYFSNEMAAALKRDASTVCDLLVYLLCRMPKYRTYIADDPKEYALIHSMLDSYTMPIKTLFLEELSDQQSKLFSIYCRLEQCMPAIAAKGYEDTLLYRYTPLISLNEVGSNISKPDFSHETFYKFQIEDAQRFPKRLLTTSTHDTKRSEDVRQRINALSEFPALFKNLIEHQKVQSQQISYSQKTLLIQTLIGFYNPNARHSEQVDRIKEYIIKATREAKQSTSWNEPDIVFEKDMVNVVEQLLSKNSSFYQMLTDCIDVLLPIGRLKSLSNLAIKIAMPGIMDIYNGDEIFFDALVDPDNRRPPNYELIQSLLKEDMIQTLKNFDVTSHSTKLALTLLGLSLRKEHPDLFSHGSLTALTTKDSSYLSFTVSYQNKSLICVAPLLPSKIPSQSTLDMEGQLPSTRWQDAVTGNCFKSDTKSLSIPYSKRPLLLTNFPCIGLKTSYT